MGLIDIDQTGDSPTGSPSFSADLVFVHGLRESGVKAWTDAKTGALWIRDIFPQSKYNVRRLVYEYDAERLMAPGGVAADSIYDEAVGLINHLNADRELLGAEARPIIFVCHEFGGLLVKRALAYSHSRNDVKIDHLRFIFRSTYAILFMSTPHEGFKKEALMRLYGDSHLGPSQFSLSLLERSGTLQEITDQFAPIRKNFHVSNFWEQQKTAHGNASFYVVERDSAAPLWDDVVRGGINATHSDMIKFGNQNAPGYRLVLATLSKHIRAAPDAISRRWEQDLEILRRSREHEADNLLRPDNTFSSTSRSRSPSQDPLIMPPPSPTPTTSTETLVNQDSGSEGPSTPFMNVHYLVRQRSDYFVGRQRQMTSLQEKFGVVKPRRSLRKPKVFVIFGLPGSGKTQFCLRYLEQSCHRYWGVFWIDCTTDATAEASYAMLGQLSGKGIAAGAGQLWLSQTLDPWLLVLDNANDPDMELGKYIPTSGNGHVIVTTRNPAAQIHNTVGAVRFQGMDPEEAVTLLLQLAYPDKEVQYRSRNRKDAETIASELGYLALALKQAAFTIRRKFLPLERYLKSLCGCRKELLSRPMIKSAEDANIAATWELPFTGIAGQTTVESRDAVEILHVFAFLHFASIPINLFVLCFNGLKESNHLKIRPLALLESSSMQGVEDRILTAARVLYDNSIISLSESALDADGKPSSKRAPRHYFTLHPAIHQWARERLGKEDSQTWLECTATILEHSISAHMETSGRGFRRLILPHIDSCLLQLEATYGAGRLPRTPQQAAYLEKFALVYAEAGRWKDARPLQLSIVEFRRKRLGRAHDATIAAQRSLANTDWNLFHIKKCLEVQYDIWLTQKLFRPSFADYFCWPIWKPTYLSHMQTLDDLTRCLWLAGMRDLSRQAGERCVEVLTQRLGSDDPLTVSAMFNLGRTYLHLGNRGEEALRLLRHALARRTHFFGPNHPDTLMSLNELGVALYAGRQDLEEAEELVRRAWETRKRVLGEEHAYTLWSANDLSKVLVELKRFEEARVLLEETAVMVGRTLGDDHVGMIMTKGNLSRVCVRCGDWKRAKELLTDLDGVVPAEHPDRLHLEWGWAYVKLYHDDDLDGAREHCEKVLKTVTETKVLAADNPRVLDTAEMLLRIYHGEERTEDIERLKRTFPSIGVGEVRSSVDFLPLERLIRRKTQERTATH